MQRVVPLRAAVIDANQHVRLTTGQQRIANAELVVPTMEQRTDASRPVSPAAVQVVAAAKGRG